MSAPTVIQLPPAIGIATAPALADKIGRAVDDPVRGAVLLKGTDAVFCKGLDFRTAGGAESLDVHAAVRAFAQSLQRLKASPRPTVALVDGPAIGGGVGLAAACDVVIASARSTFALPELLFGLIPGIISPFLLDRMTPQRLTLWAMRGEAQTAAAALVDGLVDEVVEHDRLDAAAKRWFRRLGRLRPDTVAHLKSHVHLAARDRAEAFDQGIAAMDAALGDEKLVSALRAFEEDGILPWEDA